MPRTPPRSDSFYTEFYINVVFLRHDGQKKKKGEEDEDEDDEDDSRGLMARLRAPLKLPALAKKRFAGR